jgi:hypothetical protein
MEVVSKMLQTNVPILDTINTFNPLKQCSRISILYTVTSCTPTFQDFMSHDHDSCDTETFTATSHERLKRKGKVNLSMLACFGESICHQAAVCEKHKLRQLALVSFISGSSGIDKRLHQ